jgi:hypothetical protein
VVSTFNWKTTTAHLPQCHYVGAKPGTTAIASGVAFSYSSLSNGAADRNGIPRYLGN